MSVWHKTEQGKRKMAEWRNSPHGQQIIGEAKARYRQTAWGKAHERAYKNSYRERENELARERSKRPENLAKQALRQRLRRAALIPRMHPDHREQIEAIYAAASRLGMTVDHIVPLYGENVWGLHAPQNLQIITRQENSSKGSQIPGSIQR